jgi:hypothetical protein
VLNIVRSLLFAVLAFFRTRGQLAAEILALRHQLGVLRRSVKRPQLANADRAVWVLLSRFWCSWSSAPIIVKPATVIKCRTWASRKPRSPLEAPDMGQVIQLPVVGGLHHLYTRRAA